MNRRQYLALLGGVSLAGCTGGEQADGQAGTTAPPMTPQDQSGDGGTPTDSPSPTETDSPSPTEQARVDLELGDPELVTIDRGYGTYPGADVTITNTGDAPTQTVECTFDWFDTDGEYIDSSKAYAHALGAGRTLAAREMARGIDAEIGGVEVAASTSSEPATLGVRDVSLGDTQFRASADNVLLRGRVTNERNSELGYIEAIGRVYDGEGRLLATDYTNETDLAAGADWTFEIEPRTLGRNEQVKAGDIVLTEGFF